VTRDDIIRMADEAGITPWERLEYIGGKKFSSTDEGLDGDLTCLIQFATLVAAAEREACAKVCEEGGKDESGRIHVQAWGCAKAIRARGNHEA
jgi:hypothetical protein